MYYLYLITDLNLKKQILFVLGTFNAPKSEREEKNVGKIYENFFWSAGKKLKAPTDSNCSNVATVARRIKRQAKAVI